MASDEAAVASEWRALRYSVYTGSFFALFADTSPSLSGAGLLDLPTELVQDIALYVRLTDQSHLRMSCRALLERLSQFDPATLLQDTDQYDIERNNYPFADHKTHSNMMKEIREYKVNHDLWFCFDCNTFRTRIRFSDNIFAKHAMHGRKYVEIAERIKSKLNLPFCVDCGTKARPQHANHVPRYQPGFVIRVLGRYHVVCTACQQVKKLPFELGNFEHIIQAERKCADCEQIASSSEFRARCRTFMGLNTPSIKSQSSQTRTMRFPVVYVAKCERGISGFCKRLSTEKDDDPRKRRTLSRLYRGD